MIGRARMGCFFFSGHRIPNYTGTGPGYYDQHDPSAGYPHTSTGAGRNGLRSTFPPGGPAMFSKPHVSLLLLMKC